jgi:hypothetical protein
MVLLSFLNSESLCAQAQLKSGNFLSSEYIDKLQKTRSPLTAEGSRTINLIVVEKQNNKTRVMPILNFHEGGPAFRLKQSGMLELEDSAGLKISDYLLQIVTNKKISFAINRLQTDEYVYVKNVQELISQICIAGQYVDDKDRRFVFEPNGTAKTPDGTMKFIIGVDHIPYQFDYLEDSNTHQVYKFVRKKCTLEIYRVLDAVENQHGNDGSHVEPYLSLRILNCESK